ncbi:UvrD-helicase domain-containing protein [Bacillus arachidis]|uniref:UvrD-helicase domain-containing protein n=1 Tax=Bacillus arachidis TaxID=2819290 RepID=UPI00255C5940|nr:UvrD-helicase domain-containing protein [Bacillus arachidis]WIY62162.1 3'-5' exonuclease [Bacillus arachidis]
MKQLVYDELDNHSKTDYAFDLLNQALSMVPERDNHIYNKTEQFLKNISLSDDQQKIATMNSTHLLVKGCAGSGKSITLLTRMMQKMSEELGKRFLFVSFSKELVKDAQNRFKTSKYFQQLQGQNHQVDFLTFHELAYELLKSIQIEVPLFFTSHQNLNKKDDVVRGRMLRLMGLLETEEFKKLPSIYTIKKTENTNFLLEEFSWMKGNGFITKEDYLTCKRVGRGRLPSISEKQRTTIFRLFEYYVEEQNKDFVNRIDKEDYALLVMKHLHQLLDENKYDHIFIDEVQDLQPMQLRVLVAINKGTLSLSGDERQRIYKSSPFSYKALGIKVQSGNNVVLRKNWRSTYQIMKLANSLQFKRSAEDSKYDDEKYFPRQGDKPIIEAFSSYTKMLSKVGDTIQSLYKKDPETTFAIIHRYSNRRDENAVKRNLGQYFIPKTYLEKVDGTNPEKKRGPQVYFLEAKVTKGLEFDYVFILDFDKNCYPHLDEITNLKKVKQAHSTEYLDDKRDIEEKEKRILYVALTRTKKAAFMYFSFKGNPEVTISPFSKDFPTKDFVAKNFRKTLI